MKRLVLIALLVAPSIALAQPGRLSPQGGTITEVVAGTGLTGGGTSGSVTLNVICGTGLVCAADSISVSGSYPIGSGTLNVVPLWTPNGNTLGDSIISQSGSAITVAGSTTITKDDVGSHTNRPILAITNSASTGSIAHRAELQFNTYDATNVSRQSLVRNEGGDLKLYTYGVVNLTLGADQKVTAHKNLDVAGNLTSGDSPGDVFDHNGDLAKFGSTDGNVYIASNSLNFGYSTDSDSTGAINFRGYQNGTTRFRNLIIGDGKGAAACTFTGSTKTLNCVGGLQVNGTNVNTFTTVNVIPKGNGTNLVASSWTDDGTTSTTTGAVKIQPTISGTTPYAAAKFVIDTAGDTVMNLVGQAAKDKALFFGNPSSSVDGGIVYDNPSFARGLLFRTGGNSNRMSIDASGNVGIGTDMSAPLSRLHVSSGSSGLTPAAGTLLTVENSGTVTRLSLLNNTHEMGLAFGNTTASFDGGLTYTTTRDLQLVASASVRCTISGATGKLDCPAGFSVGGTNVNTFTTNNVIPKGNGSGLVASSWTDDGTNTTTTANIIGTNAAFGSSMTTIAKVYSVVTGSGTGLRADNTSFGKTSDSYGVRSVQTGSFDSTAATLRNYGVSAQAAATRAAGSNDVINFGIYTTASGGQANYSLYGDAGTVALNVSSGNTCIGATSCSSKLSVSGTTSISGNTTIGGTLTVGGNTTWGDSSTDAHALVGTLNVNNTAGTNGQVLAIVSGLPQWTTISEAGGIDGSGTLNTIPKFTPDGNTLGNSSTTDDGTTVDTNVNIVKWGSTIDGGLYFIGAGTNNNSLNFEYGTAAIATGWINRVANAGGTGTFRNLIIGDGKTAAIVTFTGSSKLADFAGPMTVAGTATFNGILNANTDVNLGDGTADIVTQGGSLRTIFVTATALAADANDWTGCNGSLVCRISASTSGVNITGISAAATSATTSRLLIISNHPTTSEIITFKHDSASSLSFNRIYTPDGRDALLPRGQTAWFFYDGNLSRWRMIYNSAGSLPTNCTNGQVPVWAVTSDSAQWECSYPNDYKKKHFEWNDEWEADYGNITSAMIVGNDWRNRFSNTIPSWTSSFQPGRGGALSLNLNTATIGNYAQVYRGLETVSFENGIDWTMEATVKWDQLSSTSSSIATMYTSLIGFSDALGATGNSINTSDGCYFAYDKGNQLTGNINPTNLDRLECWCSKNGTRTGYLINSTGNSDNSFPLGDGTIAADTWYRLKIKVTESTKAEFYINEVKVCEIATNLPIGSSFSNNRSHPQLSIYSWATTGTGNRSLIVDQTRIVADFATARSP